MQKLKGYVLAVLFVLVALTVRLLLDPYLLDAAPFSFFYLATIGALLTLRFPGALATSVLGCLAARWFFMEPRYSLEIASVSTLLGLYTYLLVTVGLFYLARLGGWANFPKWAEIETKAGPLELTDSARPLTERLMVAVFIMAVAYLLHRLLFAGSGQILPYITFYPGVLITTVLSGLGPGLFATALGSLMAAALLTGTPSAAAGAAPAPLFGYFTLHDLTGLAVFSSMGVLMSYLASLYHAARIKAAEYDKQLAVRESEAQFKAFFESAAVGMVELDKQQRFVRVNQQFCKITGFSPQELRSLGLENITHPADWERDHQQFMEFLAEGRPSFEVETRHIHKDGHTIHVQVTAVLLRDAQGGVTRSAAVVQDISPRKEAEEALRRSAQELRELTEAMPQIVWVTLPNGHGEYFNKRWCEYTGAGAAGDLSNWGELLHPADRQATIEAWRRSLAGGEPFETRFRLRRAADGVYRWQLGRALAMRDTNGQISRWLGTCTDIHDQIKSEDALKVSQRSLQIAKEAAERNLAQLQAVVQSMAEGVLITDAAGKVLRTNRAFAAMHRCSRHLSSLRDYAHCVKLCDLSGTDLPPEEWPLTLALRGERTNARELLVKRADDDEANSFVGEFTSVPVYDEGGNIIRALMTVRDITERKQSEERLRRMLYERENLLDAERAARNEAERANRLKDEFLSTVSHELRTPLNSILGWSQLLVKKRVQPEKAIPLVEQSARAQAQLIEELLDMSRIISGRLQIEPQSVDLSEVIEAAVESIRQMAGEKGVVLEAPARTDLCCVRGDPVRLQQVLTNLLSNAVKFTDKGGKVTINTRREAQLAEIEISDTGRGIESKFLPHLFEPFRQADGTVSRRYGGLGLGLAIAKRLTQMHGGQIKVESKGPGQGAKFKVSFPLVPKSKADEIAPQRSAAGGTAVTALDVPSGTEVLVVDDDQATRELLIHLLAEHGAQVLAAESGNAALSLLEHEKPDLLISDIGMPEMDGYSLMQRIRSFGDERRSIPAIALTAFAREEDKMKALEAGFTHHLAKPLDSDTLLRLVNSLLEQRQSGGVASPFAM